MADAPAKSVFHNEVFTSGLVLLTGACDIGCAPVVTITHQALYEMEKKRITAAQIVETIEYYAHHVPKRLLDDGLAVLVDFQTAIQLSTDSTAAQSRVSVNVKAAIDLVMQALETLSRDKKLLLSTVYVLEPPSRDDAKLVKKRCGLSKKSRIPVLSFAFGKRKSDTQSPAAPADRFKVVLVTSEQELFLYIAKDSLLPNFHGDASFNLREYTEFHRAWADLDQLARTVLEPAASGARLSPETRDEAVAKCETIVSQLRNGFWRSIRPTHAVFQAVLDDLRILKIRLEHVKVEPQGALTSMSNDKLVDKFSHYSEHLRCMLDEVTKFCANESLQDLNIRKIEALRTKLEDISTGEAQILIDEAGVFCHSVLATVPMSSSPSTQNIEDSGYATIKETRGALSLRERCDALGRLINDLKLEIDRSRKDLTQLYKFYRNLYRVLKWFGKVLDKAPLDALRTAVAVTAGTKTEHASSRASEASLATTSSAGDKIPISADMRRMFAELCLRKPIPGDEMMQFAIDNVHILQTARHKTLTEFTIRRTYELLELLSAQAISTGHIETLFNWRVVLIPGRHATSKIMEELQNDLQRFEWINSKRKERFDTELSDLMHKYFMHLDLLSPSEGGEVAGVNYSLWKRMLYDVSGGPTPELKARFKQSRMPSVLTTVTETEPYSSTVQTNDNLAAANAPYADARAILDSSSPKKPEDQSPVQNGSAVENRLYAGMPPDTQHDGETPRKLADRVHGRKNAAGHFQLVSTTGDPIDVTLSDVPDEPDASSSDGRPSSTSPVSAAAARKKKQQQQQQLTTVYFSREIPSEYNEHPGELLQLRANEANRRMILESDIPEAMKAELLAALSDSRLRLKKIGRIPGNEETNDGDKTGSQQDRTPSSRPWTIESTAKIRISKPAAQYADLYPERSPVVARPDTTQAKKMKLDSNGHDQALVDDRVDSAPSRKQHAAKHPNKVVQNEPRALQSIELPVEEDVKMKQTAKKVEAGNKSQANKYKNEPNSSLNLAPTSTPAKSDQGVTLLPKQSQPQSQSQAQAQLPAAVPKTGEPTIETPVQRKPFKIFDFSAQPPPTATTSGNAPTGEMPVPLRRGSLRGSRKQRQGADAGASSGNESDQLVPTAKGDQNKLKELFEARKLNLDDGLHPEDSGNRTQASENTGGTDWSQYYDLKVPIVIDNGSGFCKCGFADQLRPSAVFPTIVGLAKYEDVLVDRDPRESVYVGEQAQKMRGVLKLSYPMEHGVVQDWDSMELIWKHAFFDQLRIYPDEHPVLLTEPPLNPLRNRERMLEVMFETFDVPAMYVAIQGTLAMYDVGSLTGIALDSGDGCTHVVPIYEGFSLQNATQKQNLAGRDVTKYMKRLLLERGHSFTSTAEFEIVRDIKEKFAYCSLDYERDMHLHQSGAAKLLTYRCSDGTEIQLGTELFKAPEYLFRTEVLQKDMPSIVDCIVNCLDDCDSDVRKSLVSNIILTGGNTLLRNFELRLQMEMQQRLPPALAKAVRVVKPENLDECVWRGGASFARVASDNDMWISRDDYYDFGPQVVHRRCF